MATFEVQVEGLTGIALDGSSTPTQTELSYFLQDGVKDVVTRMVEVNPLETPRFTTTTNSTTSVAKVGTIISVVREHDSTTILRPCTPISPLDRYEATDQDSLKFRSKFNPGYYELNGSIFCVPAAGGSDNDIVVTQLYFDTGVAFGDEVPDNFPEQYAYLVSIYASIKVLEAKMADYTITEEDYELATSTQLSITKLQRQYDAAFGVLNKKQQPQQAQGG